jgi:dipeptidyl aminopeptidase/acylaminoacyl peptidase
LLLHAEEDDICARRVAMAFAQALLIANVEEELAVFAGTSRIHGAASDLLAPP